MAGLNEAKGRQQTKNQANYQRSLEKIKHLVPE